MKIKILNRFSGAVQFSADIDCAEDAPRSVKVGLAVKWAIANGANLRDANLRGADLRGANLRDAYLRGADLGDADLGGAYLGDANLRGAYLRGAYLGDAYLRGANLGDADLRGAYLRGAYLGDAYLRGANLGDADLRGADAARLNILPDGDLIGWKKAGGHIVKLRIPTEARRSNATGRKCRAEYVEVLDIEGAEEAVTDNHGPRTVYRIGETVHADSWDECRWNECSNGIHFFISKEEALEW